MKPMKFAAYAIMFMPWYITAFISLVHTPQEAFLIGPLVWALVSPMVLGFVIIISYREGQWSREGYE